MSDRSNGSGHGYGSGHGDGYGYGDGYGDSYGSGSGSGSGSGYGYGDIYGSGYGYGSGHGDNSGSLIGSIGSHPVLSLRPWRFALVGCQYHSIDWWRDNWRIIAKTNDVSISESEVEDLLCKVTSCAAEQTDER